MSMNYIQRAARSTLQRKDADRFTLWAQQHGYDVRAGRGDNQYMQLRRLPQPDDDHNAFYGWMPIWQSNETNWLTLHEKLIGPALEFLREVQNA